MAKYKVKNTSILHDNSLYKEGSIVELDTKQAKKLTGFVEVVKDKTPAKPQQKQNKDDKTDNGGGENNGK